MYQENFMARTNMIIKLFLATLFLIPSLVFASNDVEQVNSSSNKNLEFISKINQQYYNLKKLGLKRFKCEVTVNTFDKLKESLSTQYSADDPRLKVLNSVKFYLIFDQNGQFSFESTSYIQTGNAKFDTPLQQTIENIKGLVLGFCGSWRGFIIEPIFEKMNLEYVIKNTSNGYDVSYTDDGSDVRISIDSNFRVFQTLVTIGNSTTKIVSSFTNTNQGLLLEGLNTELNNGVMKCVEAINYQTVESLQIPKHVTIQITSTMLGTQQNIELSFLNVKVNKQ